LSLKISNLAGQEAPTAGRYCDRPAAGDHLK